MKTILLILALASVTTVTSAAENLYVLRIWDSPRNLIAEFVKPLPFMECRKQRQLLLTKINMYEQDWTVTCTKTTNMEHKLQI